MKKYLTAILFFVALAGISQSNITNGLVAYFPLDNDTNDYSNYHINGINYNGLPGQSGLRNYYHFNGLNAYIYAGDDNRQISDKVSVSVWVKTQSYGFQWVVGHYDHSVDRGFQVVMNQGHAQLRGRDGSGQFYILEDPATINDNNWHHIIGLFDGNHWTIIVDCNIKNYLTTYSNNPYYSVDTQPFSISKYPELNNGVDPLHFNGDIDQVRVYNRILSICDICQIHSIELYEGDPTSIQINELDNPINLYPNPSKNSVNIVFENDNNKKYELFVYDMSGKMMTKTMITNRITLDISGYKKGIYSVIILNDQQKFYKKLIIK